MFELLFNAPLAVWRDGRLRFESTWPLEWLALVAVAAVIVIFMTLVRTERPLSWPRRGLIGALQCVAVFALLFALWRPVLEVEATRPGENAVAWVLDGSRSMDIADIDGRSRRDAALALANNDDLVDQDLFEVAYFSVTEGLQRAGTDGLALVEGSAIASALSSVLDSVDEQALAAVVLVSDGSENQGGVDATWWQSLGAAGVPVHVIGVGSTSHGNDVELADVQLAARAAVNATVVARIRLRHAPGSGNVRVTVSSGDELLLAEDVTTDPTADETLHEARFTLARSGVQVLDFRVADDGSDPNVVNNVQSRVIRIEDQRKRALYVEGEPRWEFKFLRRALDGDPAVEIVSLLRTSPNKFYRQGVANADELASGFPSRREDLFAYDAVIIGSLEAAQLTSTQQAALRDFVSVRGGALLMLGGREGLADGGWARSSVAAALPVTLDARLDASTYSRERVSVLPTRQGLRSDWLTLQSTSPLVSADLQGEDGPSDLVELDAMAVWRELPALADFQRLGQVKPGALVLLESTDGQPVYVTQRYGLGTSQVLGTGGTWRWQMRLPSEDQRHEQFWRNVVSRLAESSLPRVEVKAEADVLRDREASTVSLVARDEAYLPVQADRLRVVLVDPDGVETGVTPVADASRPGYYSVGVPATPAGVWSLRASVQQSGDSAVGSASDAEAFWIAETGVAEDFNTRQQKGFLERIADISGGQYFTPDSVASLPDALTSSSAALTRLDRIPLWYMPALFLLVLMAKLMEWVMRLRWKRL